MARRLMPRFELLEDRVVPTSVTNLNDSGPGSLRYVLAGGASSIDFDRSPGTASDIAGTAIADERSMLEALKQAEDLATRRAVQTA